MKRSLTIAVLLVALPLMVVPAGPRPRIEQEVYIRKLFLVDASGRVRATLMTSDDARDSVSLMFLTPDGKALLGLSLLANGNAHIGIDDYRGTRAQLVMGDAGGGMVVYDSQGNAVHRLITER
jgi:hypothetical protein